MMMKKIYILFISSSVLLIGTIICLAVVEQKELNLRYKRITKFLSSKSLDYFDLEREILTLSFIADGLREKSNRYPKEHKELTKLSQRAIEHALRSPVLSLSDQQSWKNEGLFLFHLNIILGSYYAVTGDSLYLPLNRKISSYLSEEINRAPFHNMQSYGSMSDRWPADNSAALYSLWLYDKNFNTSLSEEPIRNWLNLIDSVGIGSSTKLHISEMTGCETYSNTPRGCALSMTIYYMSRFAPDEAKKLWRRYKREMKITLLPFAGFREYPKKSDLGEDYDSGPIIFGAGASATGLGIIAAASMNDRVTSVQIQNALHFMDFIIWVTNDKYLRRERYSMNAESILFLRDCFR